MNYLTAMVDEYRSQGVIDPKDIASRIAIRLQSMSRNDLVTFITPLLPESIRTVYSRERLGLPEKTMNAARSGKVRMIREAYGKVIGLPSGEWKRIGDCTRPDLIDYSGMLEDTAHKTLEKARWYRMLAEQLPDDSTTVEQAGLSLTRAA